MMFVNRFFLFIIVMMITNLTYSQHTSIEQYLNGRVSGLRVSSLSGTPGTMSQMRIRGEGSYSLSNEPLIVIDGLPFFNSEVKEDPRSSGLNLLSMINPSDIESVTVLKDAASTAQYGMRGTNGVIVITTKNGSRSKTLKDLLIELIDEDYEK